MNIPEALPWYLCLRKQSLTKEEAEARASALGLRAFPCLLDGSEHYHVGKPNQDDGVVTARVRQHARRALAKDIAKGRIYLRGEPVPI